MQGKKNSNSEGDAILLFPNNNKRFNEIRLSGGPMNKWSGDCKGELSFSRPHCRHVIEQGSQGIPGIQRREKLDDQPSDLCRPVC